MNMSKRLLLFCVLCALLALQTYARRIEPAQTLLYAVKESDSLYLDRYLPLSSVGTGEKHPCLIFVFGGSFSHGKRDDGQYLPFFRFLTEQGIEVVSIDYRLGLSRGLEMNDASAFTAQMEHSIRMAAEDMLTATRFVTEHAATWGVDTDKILSCGSSAGAITVLQAAYACTNFSEKDTILPAGFNYAGVISMAGALFVEGGAPQWGESPPPILFFHGEADGNVPYDRLTVGGIDCYGSHALAAQFKEMNIPYAFYSVKNENHRLSSSPMQMNRDEIMIFIRRMALGKEKIAWESNVTLLDRPSEKKEFTIQDYLMNNYANP